LPRSRFRLSEIWTGGARYRISNRRRDSKRSDSKTRSHPNSRRGNRGTPMAGGSRQRSNDPTRSRRTYPKPAV